MLGKTIRRYVRAEVASASFAAELAAVDFTIRFDLPVKFFPIFVEKLEMTFWQADCSCELPEVFRNFNLFFFFTSILLSLSDFTKSLGRLPFWRLYNCET